MRQRRLGREPGAAGGALARTLGGAPTICWALVLSAPLLAPFACARLVATGVEASGEALAGFAYVSLISMFGAFVAWYAGLARGGVARIGQVQLMQAPLAMV